MIIAIDPGTTESAWLRLDNGRPVDHGKCPNDDLRRMLHLCFDESDRVSIEMVASYGMAVGREVFETCVWIGRFAEAWRVRQSQRSLIPAETQLIYRRDVKLFHCYSARANDANIRAAIIDRFGGKERAIGSKKAPGPLYGIKADIWSALAIALMVEGKAATLPHSVPLPAREIAEVPFG